jgi:hypothetical protein
MRDAAFFGTAPSSCSGLFSSKRLNWYPGAAPIKPIGMTYGRHNVMTREKLPNFVGAKYKKCIHQNAASPVVLSLDLASI